MKGSGIIDVARGERLRLPMLRFGRSPRRSRKAQALGGEASAALTRLETSVMSARPAGRGLSMPMTLPISLGPVKTATGGYDGKGQFVLRSEDQIDQAWMELGPAGD